MSIKINNKKMRVIHHKLFLLTLLKLFNKEKFSKLLNFEENVF